MHRYQVWVICAILLALAPLSGLHSKQIQSSDDDTRYSYSENFSTLSSLNYLENTHLDTTTNQLALQLDDHIIQQAPVVVGFPASDLASGPEDDSKYVYVVWHDLRNDAGDIYAQKLDTNGMRMWPENKDVKVNNSPDGTTQSAPAAAVDSDGDLWVVWVDDRNGNNDIYAQGLNSKDGDRRYPKDQPVVDNSVNDSGAEANQGAPAVAIHDTTLIVVWHDDRDDNDFDIYAEKFDVGNGDKFTPSDDSLQLNREANGPQTSPSIGVDKDGNAIVAWLDQRIGNGDIYAQKILEDDSRLWEEDTRVNKPEHGAQKPPAVVMKSDGQAIVSWLSSAEDGNQVYMSEINGENDVDIDIYGGPANFGVQPAATLVGDHIAIGWKQINDGHLYINIRDLDMLSGPGKTGKIDEENDGGAGNRSEMLSLAALNDKEVFAVWVDTRDGRKTDIYGQKLNLDDGKAVWSQARFINDSSGQIDQQNPAVAVDNDGNSIVAWYSERGGQSNLFLQKISLDGKAVWGQGIPVSDSSIQGQSLVPDLAVLGDDILITWADKRTGVSSVYVQRFDPDGNRVWSGDQLVSSRTVGQFSPQIVTGEIAAPNSSEIFIVWQENIGTASQIAFQKLDDAGQPVWEKDKIIESDGGSLRSPTLALTDDGIAIAWTSTSIAGGDTDLYLQIFPQDEGEEPLTGRIQVNQFDGLVDQINPPALAADQSGNLTAIWVDRRASAIYASGYYGNGGINWSAIKLNQVPGSFSPNPDIAAVPNSNNTVVVWQGMNQGELSIYAQRLDAEGRTFWPLEDTTDAEMAVMVSANSQNAWLPAVAVNNDGDSTIVWREERNMNQDIYLRQLNSNGEHLPSKDVPDVAVVGTDIFYRSKGLAQSNNINTTGKRVQKALLTYQGVLNSGQITFTLTNDSGANWDTVQPGVMHPFTTTGSDPQWQAHLYQPNVANLSLSPFISGIQIYYTSTTTVNIDSYEPDDDCRNALPIQPNGIVQERTLHPTPTMTTTNGDEDWIFFRTDVGKKYILLTEPTDGSSSLQMEVFDSCTAGSRVDKRGLPDNPAHSVLSAEKDKYYVKIFPSYPIVQSVPYQFSVRPVPSEGLAIIVAGAHDDDKLKNRVDQSTGRVGKMLSQNGFITSSLSSPTLGKLQVVFQEQNEGTDTPLIVYLVGQLDPYGGFKLSEDGYLTPDMLDLWLSNLEDRGKIGQVIVVIETDKAGSFIEELSGTNRIIVAATDESGSIEATPEGFLFSDAFWWAMVQGYSVQQSFNIGKQVVSEIGSPCLPSTANCKNTPLLGDSMEQAFTIGLGASTANAWKVPAIEYVSVGRFLKGIPLTITVSVTNPQEVSIHIEAHIKELTSDGEHVTGSPITLKPNSSNLLYSGKLPISKDTKYRVTIYGWNDSLTVLPKTSVQLIPPQTSFFPFISR